MKDYASGFALEASQLDFVECTKKRTIHVGSSL